MAETKPIPVRLDEALIRRLDAASARMGNNRSGLIRFCAETFLNYFEEKGSEVVPPDWLDILTRQDGRTREGKAAAAALNDAPAPKIPPAAPTGGKPFQYDKPKRKKKGTP